MEFLDAADMGFDSVDGGVAELVYGFEIVLEHIWMLVIFGIDVGFDCVGEGDIVGASKREEEDVGPL